MARFKLRSLFWLVAVFAFGCLIVSAFQDRIVFDASRQDVWLRLPDDASHINCFLPGAFGPTTYFEFDTSEESFFEWVKGYEKVIRVLRPGPYRVSRYPAYAPEADRRNELSIGNGYLFESTEEDRGLYIAYDRDNGRAYFWSHSR